MSAGLAREFAKVLRRAEFVDRHYRAVVFKGEERAATVARIPQWNLLRTRARMLKSRVRGNLETLRAQFAAAGRARGAQVYFAPTAAQANERVLAIARRHGAREVVKSKSMTTEECGLNPYLEERGIHVTDTDLGERIVQLFGEPPSHIVTPAIHRSRREIGDLFARHGLVTAGEEDPERLTVAARRSLRQLFLTAEMGITGANFLVAETGTVVVVENEGNSLLGTSLPRVHVVVAGIEKLIERTADLGVFLTLLAPSSTGQLLTTYTTHYTGAQPATAAERAAGIGPHELHIILLDNGRSDLIGTPAEEALACIRCGACLNVCPVYRRVGGHAYDYVYPGPIGKVLGPGLGAGKAELVKASALCGACTEVCPVGIDLAKHIQDWRGRLRSQRRLPRALPPGMGYLMRNPDLWHVVLRAVRGAGRAGGFLLQWTPWVRAFTAGGRRRLPRLPARSFRSWWREREHPAAPSARWLAVPTARPTAPSRSSRSVDLETLFEESLGRAGGRCVGPADIPAAAVATAAAAGVLHRLAREAPPAPLGKFDLDGTEWLVATARRRIARKGALWVDFADLESRAQLLLPEGLVLLVPQAEIVLDLPQHYDALRRRRLPDCGTLVAGPSKTADIEQTLVMGAHGPRRLLVVPYRVEP